VFRIMIVDYVDFSSPPFFLKKGKHNYSSFSAVSNFVFRGIW
jgi:hypothetical protein